MIPFVGAGVSRLAGCPDWKGFADGALLDIIQQGKLSHSQLDQINHLSPRVKLSFAIAIAEANDILLWEEDAPWPAVYSTILQELTNVLSLHRHMIEKQIAETGAGLTAKGFAPENVQLLSEFPRQLPPHLHYAMASLGAWLGGAINVQYFSYYASIRQITHSSLNLKYAERVGFEASESQVLDGSGIAILPASLVAPLLGGSGNRCGAGSLPIDEINAINQPDRPYFETQDVGHEKRRPGIVLDKFYRTPFWARTVAPYAFYGTDNVLPAGWTSGSPRCWRT